MSNEPTPHLVFSIADCLLALPLKDVLRVINYPPQARSDPHPMGVMQMGQHLLKIVDLHQWVQPDATPDRGNHQFLIVTNNIQEGLLGIPIDGAPDLMEFFPENMHSLPQAEKRSSLAEIVSHAVVIPQQETTSTIFLLQLPIIKHANPKSLSPEKQS